MRKSTGKKILTLTIISLIFITSFSAAASLNKQKYSRLNPAVVQILLSSHGTLGKIIDNDFTILEINEKFVIVFSSSEEIRWLEEQNLNPKILYNDYSEMMGWKKTLVFWKNFILILK